MVTKTITIDTVEEFFNKHEADNWIVQTLREWQPYIEEIDFAEPDNECAFNITFKADVNWPHVVMYVSQMRADECWGVKADKTVTLWWD